MSTLNLTRCPKEFNKIERRWWKFYLPVVQQRGLMTIGKWSTLRDLCHCEYMLEYNMQLIRESNGAAMYQESEYMDSAGIIHKKITTSPVKREIDNSMKLKQAHKKALGLFDVPAETEKQQGMEGLLDG